MSSSMRQSYLNNGNVGDHETAVKHNSTNNYSNRRTNNQYKTAAAVGRNNGVCSSSATFCSYMWCLLFCLSDTCRWIPVVFISAVILWSYYAYTVELCFFAVDNVFQRALYIVFYHLFFTLFTWSYASTILRNPGTPQKRFSLTVQQLEQLTNSETAEQERMILLRIGQNLPILCRQSTGDVRYCKPCAALKPDRCHHCSICRRCVLKMDHHCPWVNNCVGFANYKSFILFLFYATVYCSYIALTDMPYFLRYWKLSDHKDVSLGHRMQIIFLGLVASMFILGVLSLLSYHIYLLLNNKTTIESFRVPIFALGGENKRGFGIGWKNNFIQVFGSDPKLWPFPILTSVGNGNSFPVSLLEPESGSLLLDDYDDYVEYAISSNEDRTNSSHLHPSSQNGVANGGGGGMFSLNNTNTTTDSSLSDTERRTRGRPTVEVINGVHINNDSLYFDSNVSNAKIAAVEAASDGAESIDLFSGSDDHQDQFHSVTNSTFSATVQTVGPAFSTSYKDSGNLFTT